MSIGYAADTILRALSCRVTHMAFYVPCVGCNSRDQIKHLNFEIDLRLQHLKTAPTSTATPVFCSPAQHYPHASQSQLVSPGLQVPTAASLKLTAAYGHTVTIANDIYEARMTREARKSSRAQ